MRAVRTPVRILHTSDLHLGEAAAADGRHGAALDAIVDLALERAVHLVLLVGDVFDSNRVPPAALDALVAAVDRLDVPVVVLPGNHDTVVPGCVWERLDLPDHVRVLRDPAGEWVAVPEVGVEVWGRPHVTWADHRPLDGIPPRGEAPWQVALAHGHLVRGPADAQRAYLLTAEELAASGRDYVALGHWDAQHDVSVGGVTAWYSGSPTRVGACALVTLADGEGGPAVRVEAVRVERG